MLTITTKQAQFLREWAFALRSGKYQQTKEVLKRVNCIEDEDGDLTQPGYCCLGVACEVAGLTFEGVGIDQELVWPGHESNRNRTALLAADWQELTGLPFDIQGMLIDLNDEYDIVRYDEPGTFHVISRVIDGILQLVKVVPA